MNARTKARGETTAERIDRLEQTIENQGKDIERLYQLLVLRGQGLVGNDEPDKPAYEFFRNMTTKQHCVMQMMLNGKGTPEMAQRLGVGSNTIKGHIRSMYQHVGVPTRAQFMARIVEPFKLIGPDEYVEVSGGLPKTWDDEYREPDVHRDLYARSR